MWTWAVWVLPLLCKFSLTAPPAKPENISCVLYYQKNLTCTWSPEERTSYTKYIVKMTYSYGKKSVICEANSSTSASCSFFNESITPPDNCSIEVEARNADGVIKSGITYWHLFDILKIEPPEILSVKPVLGVKRMVQIKWERQKSLPPESCLKYTLRFRTVNSTLWMEVNFESKHSVYNLTGLKAFTEYVIALRSKTNRSRFWSDWSPDEMGITEEEAPHGLDLWRVLRSAKVDGRRTVRLFWKKARGTPVLEKTLGYNIWYFPENNTNFTETKNTTNQELDLDLGDETYWVSVTSYNCLGESPAATLRIPATQEKTFQCIKVMQACLAQDQLVVEWQSSAPEVDTWMVEWLPDLDSELSAFSWELVLSARNWTIHQDKLKPFLCYNISVYPMLRDQVGEPYSIQAYVKEGIPAKGPMTKADNIGVKTVTITWQEIPRSERNGFISNYTIFYQAEGGKEFSKTVNSSILQYVLESLTRQTSYTVWVVASTRAGGTSGPKISFKTLSISIFETTSLVGGVLVMLIILTASGLKSPKLTHLFCPDVPNPAESSIAMWRGHDFKDKLNLKEFDDSVNTEEDRILKPCFAPTDLIDKLVVSFENFLEEVSTEEAGKSPENILGGETNEYVTSPFRPDCPPGKSFEELLVLTDIPSRKSQHLCLGRVEETCLEGKEQRLSSGQSLRPNHLCEEETLNPYLKNSVTTREFLVHEKLPDHIKMEI